MNPTSTVFDWLLNEDKVRDGRYVPVFLSLRTDTAELITAEQLHLGESANADTLERVLSHLDQKQIHPSEPNFISYLGYQHKAEHIFILTQHSSGGTLREFIEKNGVIHLFLARNILRQIVLGLEQLQKQGLTVILLDSKYIQMDNKAAPKIEAPLLDVTVIGQQLPPALLTLPERILCQQNIARADVWLLGIVAVQLLSRDCNIAATASTSDIGTQIEQNLESAWELFVLRDVASKLDERALDFLRQCFIMKIDDRPSISTLKEHPFINNEE